MDDESLGVLVGDDDDDDDDDDFFGCWLSRIGSMRANNMQTKNVEHTSGKQ